MWFVHYGSIALLLILFFLQWRAKSFLARNGKRLYLVAIVTLAAALFYDLHSNFSAIIASGPPNRYFAPPYVPIGSFLFSSWSRTIGPYTISLAISLLALWGMTAPANYKDRFEAGEPYIIAISLLALRHPFWGVFIILTFAFYLISSGYLTLRYGGERRASWYYAWLPLSIITLGCTPLLAKIPLLNLLGLSNVY